MYEYESKIYKNICMYIYKNLAIVVRVDPKDLFSIATTQRYKVGTTPFPGSLNFILDNAEC